MSYIIKNFKSIQDEHKQLYRKTIQKQKHRNQYSQPAQIITTRQNEELIQKHILVEQTIPKGIMNKSHLRFHSNIQLPIELDSDNKLGELTIDPHTYNYKVTRTEHVNNLLIFTFQPYDREFTPFDQIHSYFQQKNQELARNMKSYNHRFKELQLSTLDEVQQYQNKLTAPFECFVNKYTTYNNVTQTLQRIMNSDFLKLLAVNEEMLSNYLKETSFLPFLLNFDTNDSQQEMLNSCFKVGSSMLYSGILKQDSKNYNGEKLQTVSHHRRFIVYDAQEDCYYEFQFVVHFTDEHWINEKRVRKNNMNYFNLKPTKLQSAQKVSYCDLTNCQSNRICGYKEI